MPILPSDSPTSSPLFFPPLHITADFASCVIWKTNRTPHLPCPPAGPPHTPPSLWMTPLSQQGLGRWAASPLFFPHPPSSYIIPTSLYTRCFLPLRTQANKQKLVLLAESQPAPICLQVLLTFWTHPLQAPWPPQPWGLDPAHFPAVGLTTS